MFFIQNFESNQLLSYHTYTYQMYAVSIDEIDEKNGKDTTINKLYIN